MSDWRADVLSILGAWDYAVQDPQGVLGGRSACGAGERGGVGGVGAGEQCRERSRGKEGKWG